MSTIRAGRRLLLADMARKRSSMKAVMPLQSLTTVEIPYLNTKEVNYNVLFFSTRTLATEKTPTISTDQKIYLHVGPSGDCWIGDAIFAAKHNQPGYVKSIALINEDTTNFKRSIIENNEEEGDLLIEILDEHPEWAQEIYDNECFPESLRRHMQSLREEDTKS